MDRSWVNSALQRVATIRVAVSRTGYQHLRKFAAQWPNAALGVEGAGGLSEQT